MDTPICDFVRRYAASDSLRLHMPGHKGCGPLGIEHLDITEISGADSLYEAEGIIAKSEENASSVFGCPTFYSTEGSSQCIRAMLYLSLLYGKQMGRKPLIAAGRNAHKVLLSAAALLDAEITWLYPKTDSSYLSCPITAEDLNAALDKMPEKPAAVYVTSPDYLGNLLDIEALAAVAHRHGCLLMVDNAHGAYLKFLSKSLHPMDLGADLCCDSAHKTLPVLTGGAYLHTSPTLSGFAKNALALFGSTSPSYLILQSLDAANSVLSGNYPARLAEIISAVESVKARLHQCGYHFLGDEPTKLTIDARAYGYIGTELAARLRQTGIECEFSDSDYLVLMVTPETDAAGLKKLEQVLTSIEPQKPIDRVAPHLHIPARVLSIREAVLSPSEALSIDRCEGRILAAATVGCPPAVPIIVSGERIDRETINRFHYYGIDRCWVVIE
jgi:arginine/lysine/ornithine decarboxylase